jgi:hypothetical protein
MQCETEKCQLSFLCLTFRRPVETTSGSPLGVPCFVAVLPNFHPLSPINIDATLPPEFWLCYTSTPPSSEQRLWPICPNSNTTSSLARRTSIRARTNVCRVFTCGSKRQDAGHCERRQESETVGRDLTPVKRRYLSRSHRLI